MSTARLSAGYLEECQAQGLPFIGNTTGESNPPLIVAKVSLDSGFQDAYLSQVRVQTSYPRLLCNVHLANGSTVIPSSVFATATVEHQIGDYIHGFVHNVTTGASFTYILKPDETFYSEIIDYYYLAPVCVEANVGFVSLFANETPLASGTVSVLEGYNYQLETESTTVPTMVSAVIIGAGLGQVPCSDQVDPELLLRTIDGVEPNEKGEFSVQTPAAQCLNIDPVKISPAADIPGPGLFIDSHCAPCCRCGDYLEVSAYLKKLAVAFAQLQRDYKEALDNYNTTSTKFGNATANCLAHNQLGARVREWPQHGFKLQPQVLLQNNTKLPIKMNKVSMKVSMKLAEDISATDEAAGGISYSLSANEDLSMVPLPDSTHYYHVDKNPKTGTGENPDGDLKEVEFVAPLAELGSTAIVEPCTGYAMLSGGLSIVHPIFRKIVNIKGISVPVIMTYNLSYEGTAPGLGCDTGVEDRTFAPITKTVDIKPNKSAISPCDNAQAQDMTQDAGGTFKLSFPTSIYGSATFTAQVDTYDSDTGEWTDGTPEDVSVSFPAGGSSDISPTINSPGGTFRVTLTYIAGGGLVTKCPVAEGDSDETVDIQVAPFTLFYSVSS